MAATEAWVLQNRVGESPSPVILTSVTLEESLSRRNASIDESVVSVFDGLIDKVFRYLHLTRFYTLREKEIQAWYIPVSQAVLRVTGVRSRNAYNIFNELV